MTNLFEKILKYIYNLYISSEVYKRNLLLGITKDKFEYTFSESKYINEGIYYIKGIIYFNKDASDILSCFSHLYVDCDVGFIQYFDKKRNIKANLISNNIELDGIQLLKDSYSINTSLKVYGTQFYYLGNSLKMMKELGEHEIKGLYLGKSGEVYEIDKINLLSLDITSLKEKIDFIQNYCKYRFDKSSLILEYIIDNDAIQFFDSIEVFLNDWKKKQKQFNSLNIKDNLNLIVYIHLIFNISKDENIFVEDIKCFMNKYFVLLKSGFLKMDFNQIRIVIDIPKSTYYLYVFKSTYIIVKNDSCKDWNYN